MTSAALRFALLLACPLLSGRLPAGEEGRLLSQSFKPEDFRGEAQVLDCVQAGNGLIYLATLSSVKEYDGETWRSIPIPSSWVMDLAVAPNGNIVVACVDELGWLVPDANGQLVFQSLLEHVPAELRPLGQAWGCAWHDGAAFWCTKQHVFRWRDGHMRVWSFPRHERQVLYDGGRDLYLASNGGGLYRLRGDDWVPACPDFDHIPSRIIDDWGGASTVILDTDSRLWDLRPDGSREELRSELAGAAGDSRAADAVKLVDGRLAVANRTLGVFVLRPDGSIDVTYGPDGGLSVPTLYSLSSDNQGGLWVGTALGAIRIELDPSLTVFDEASGAPPGFGFIVARHEGALYGCGSDGLYRLEPGAGLSPGHFTRVPTQESFSPYDLVSHSSGLLVASEAGVFRLKADDTVVLELPTSHSVYTLERSTSDPDRVFLGGADFVGSARWDGTRWVDEGRIEGVSEDARSLVEDAAGDLWIGTPSRGAVRVRRSSPTADWRHASPEVFDTSRGLPEGHDWLTVYATPEGPLFAHAKGASVLDPATGRLVTSPLFDAAGIAGLCVFPATAGAGDALWLQLGSAASGDTLQIGGLQRGPEGVPTWYKLSAAVLSELGFVGASDMAWEPGRGGDGVLWILGSTTIVRVDLTAARAHRDPPAPAVLVRGVTRGDRTLPVHPAAPLDMAFGPDELHVRYASPVYTPGSSIEYQYRLSGFDERWSGWTRHPETVFTNLPSGSFGFEIRARRAGGLPGETTTWPFAVAPPSWRSAPALAGYGIGSIALIGIFLRWRTDALQRERRRLEEVVRERTVELAQERDRAEAANRAKTMFLASMSHELRTPLHAILGYSQLLAVDESIRAGARERLQIVAASGQHLLGLINEVLDLSKIEAGKIELKAEPFALPALLEEVASAQAARAAAKRLVFRRPDAAGVPGMVIGDPAKLRQVLDNLLSNAVKFTGRGEVRLATMPVASDRVRFEVSDTGVGIAPDDLREVFQPFMQTSAGRDAAEGGTGLGLAISQRLVRLMGGELHVASTPGEGSRFWFDLPLQDVGGRVDATQVKRRIVGYDGPRRRILVIDDVSANRELFTDLLAPLGFEVASAETAESALEMFAHVRPDLVILDLRLPGMNGFELARRLRADPAFEGLKILAASASVLGHDPGEARAAGCDGFIAKPFLRDEFLDRVAALLGVSWRELDLEPAASHEPLDPAMLAELRTAADVGDVVSIRRIVARMRERHPRAVALAAIEVCLESFDTRGVSRLAQEGLDASEGRGSFT